MPSAPPLPRTKNPFDARLRAVHKAHQQEAFVRVQRMVAEIGAMGAQYRERLMGVLATPRTPAEDANRIRAVIAGVLPKLIEALDGKFRALAEWSYDAEVDGMIYAIPNVYWGKLTGMNLPESTSHELAPGLDPITEKRKSKPKKGRPPRGVVLGPFRGESEAEPIARGLVPKREVDKAIRDALFPAPPRAKVSEILRSGYNGQGWIDHLKGLSGKIADFNALADDIALGMSRGENVQQLAKRITPKVGGIVSSAQRVARTEGLRVSQEMQRASWAQVDDITIGVQIIATLDQFTRPEHAARHGTIYYKDPKPGQASFDEAPQTPDEPNCLLPGNVVSGEFIGGLKASYSGQVIEVRTRQGRSFTVTPNHPVLTEDGFVPAHALCQGVNLVCHSVNRVGPSGVPQHEQCAPAKIEDAFETLRSCLLLTRVQSGSVDFHGDEPFIEGDVDVVIQDRKLLLDSVALCSQGIGKRDLSAADMQAASVAGERASTSALDTINLPATCSPGATSLSLDQSVCLDSLPFQKFCFGPTAKLNASCLESLGEGQAVESLLVCHLFERYAGEVSLDEVVDVRNFHYTGHVYDLQSTAGWYASDGLILHNCRCYLTPVLAPPVDIAENPELAAQWESPEGTIPDPATYDQWFAQQDADVQREAVGARRYDAVARRLGDNRSPDWSDFIDPDGKLLAASSLKAEDDFRRAERKAAVQAEINRRGEWFRQVAEKGFVTPDARKL